MNRQSTNTFTRRVMQLALLLLPVVSLAQAPANDLCTGAEVLTQNITATTVPGTLVNATYTTMTTSCTAGTQNDVWYSFVAKSGSVLIAVTPAGNPPDLRFQLYNAGSCGGTESSVGCYGASATIQNLGAGNTYLIRVYSNINSAVAFSISVTTVIVNGCGGSAPLLVPGNPGAPTEGFIFGTSNDGPVSTCGTSSYDVWYRFVASTTNSTVLLSNTGSEFTNPAVEVYSGTCGAFTSLGCGTASVALSGLALGTTYYVRVFSTGGATPVTKTNTTFRIAVNDGPIDNDLAVNAQLLNSTGTTCSNVFGTLKFASASGMAEAVPGSCGDATAGDVWYKFVAASPYAKISVSGAGAQITAATGGGGYRMQLLDGVPGSFNQMICASAAYDTKDLPAGRTLEAGKTYYVRVTTLNPMTGPVNIATNAYRFSICITETSVTATAPRFGNTYVNVSKRNVGGVVEKGDTLEVRMTIALTAGLQFNPRFVDNIPSNTQMLASSNDSIRIITNEGLTYKRYTPAAGDDAATYLASPPAGEYNIRINMGFGAYMPAPAAPLNNTDTDPSGTGQMSSGARPLGGGKLLFATAFRVVVTGDPGDIINLGSGKFIYRNSPSGPDLTVSTIPYKILISTPKTLCANSTGVNNAFEFGGTFGADTSLNRKTGLAYSTSYTYTANMGYGVNIGDGTFGIVKSTSPREGTVRTAQAKPNCILPVVAGDMNSCYYRMYEGHWEIDGDHSGTNNSIGNPPPAAGASSGYMLVVNADYVASEVYTQTISNLCPNTYYEFSAWVRNICSNCGVDSTATQTWKPGVNPNLTFILDDIDQYNTGEIELNGWQKKGFVFVTGPSQTSLKFSIRNNAQGGGGNDWAMDDVSIATCLPNMSYSPTLNPSVCIGNALTINDTVRSYFNNYGHHQWQRSSDNGVSWSDVGSLRSYTPAWNATLNTWEYITSYTIPPSNTTTVDSGTLYRVIVATAASNVGNVSCQVTDGISIINLAVRNCSPILSTDLLSFSGQLINEKGSLAWTTSREETYVEFVLERSNDGINYSYITKVSGYNNGSTLNNYGYVDASPPNGKVFYRLAMVTIDGNRKYSRIVQLSKTPSRALELINMINPFQSSLRFDLMAPSDTRINVALIDIFGKTVKTLSYKIYEGMNTVTLPSTDNLPAGTYVLLINHDGKLLQRKVIKRNAP